MREHAAVRPVLAVSPPNAAADRYPALAAIGRIAPALCYNQGTVCSLSRDRAPLERYQPGSAMFREIAMYPREVFAPAGTGEAAVCWSARVAFKDTGLTVDEFFGMTYFKFNSAGLIDSARVFLAPAVLDSTAHASALAERASSNETGGSEGQL